MKIVANFPSVVFNVYAFAIILFLLRLQFLHFFISPSSLCRHYHLYLPFYPSSVCFHIYRSSIFLLLNDLLSSSHISLFLVSLPFHFSGSFFFIFFVILLFHSSSYSFSFISPFIMIFFTDFSPLCFSSTNPLSFFYFLFSVLLLFFFCASSRSRFKASLS